MTTGQNDNIPKSPPANDANPKKATDSSVGKPSTNPSPAEPQKESMR